MYFHDLRDYGCITDSDGAEHAAVAIDFRGRAERFGIVVRKLHRRAAFRAGNFADQADRVEAAIRRWGRSRGNRWSAGCPNPR